MFVEPYRLRTFIDKQRGADRSQGKPHDQQRGFAKSSGQQEGQEAREEIRETRQEGANVPWLLPKAGADRHGVHPRGKSSRKVQVLVLSNEEVEACRHGGDGTTLAVERQDREATLRHAQTSVR